MIKMKLTRRDFIKRLKPPPPRSPASAPDGVAQQKGKTTACAGTKGVCRYCGTGCGVLVGVRDGRVVATQGDPDAPVNRGLNCIKGLFPFPRSCTARTA